MRSESCRLTSTPFSPYQGSSTFCYSSPAFTSLLDSPKTYGEGYGILQAWARGKSEYIGILYKKPSDNTSTILSVLKLRQTLFRVTIVHNPQDHHEDVRNVQSRLYSRAFSSWTESRLNSLQLYPAMTAWGTWVGAVLHAVHQRANIGTVAE